MKIVIMAGGKGTRIRSINSEVPKPMIRINNKPILEYQIDSFSRQGYKEFIIVIGHLGNQIEEYFGDGSSRNISIRYIKENEPLGTAGSLYFLKNNIDEDFLLINGDSILDIDLERFVDHHIANKGVATILTHPNDHPYDSGIVVYGEDRVVTKWLHKEDKRGWYKNSVNAGLHMLNPSIFKQFKCLEKKDLDRDILRPLIKDKTLIAYSSPEYVKDMGTPKRYKEVINDVNLGKVQSKNLKNKQKAIFLDRDGVINKYCGFLTNIEQFELEKDVAKAIRLINQSGYLAIVITNQPVIARGDVTWEELTEIHNKMETLLGNEGAYLDDIFICPHHPDKGFEGEIKKYKIDCDCRKPKPGLLLQARDRYNIDMGKSWMIGDSESDIKAGCDGGCNARLLKKDDSLVKYIKEIIKVK